MSGIPLVPEQDRAGGDNLPTYDDLAVQNGPNSRFGRWKGWVEKRAAERYVDVTPDELARRRARGWGDSVHESDRLYPIDTSSSFESSPFDANDSRSSFVSDSASDLRTYALDQNAPILPASEPLLPSRARLYSFGSRFLPHARWPINALLPLMGDRLLLIGHDNGLSVMDMFPSGDPETSGPGEALVRPIWEGEGVYQLELLEFQDTGDGTAHGVVLALIGIENEQANSKERDTTRVVRMYNLSSLTSLARWAATQQNSKPIDLRQSASWSPHQTKKHKHNSSIVKLKSLVSENTPSNEPNSPFPRAGHPASQLKRGVSDSSEDSTWDTFEDMLPMRWAGDYVPLASSKRLQSNVIFFELKKNESSAGNLCGPTLLAIATKASILLYETPKGERAFRFVKEFYMPVPPRGLSFVQQHVQEAVVLRSLSSSSARSGIAAEDERRFNSRNSLDVSREYGRPVSPVVLLDYGAQLSLFVVFEKKAGLIRLSDSFVGEVELNEDILTSPSGATSPRRSFVRETKAVWLPPSYEEIPKGSSVPPDTLPVYLLTRGKQTHIVKSPLPIPLSSAPPLAALTWQHPPNHISHRICSPFREQPFLQVVGFGEYGVEVQEVPLTLISGGKGKSRRAESVYAHIDIGGDVGFLCRGGQWNKPLYQLLRSDSFMSYSTNGTARLNRDERGFYGWLRRDSEDWRVFWVGGLGPDDTDLSE